MKQYLIISIMLISLFTISCQSKENIGSNKNYEKVNNENINQNTNPELALLEKNNAYNNQNNKLRVHQNEKSNELNIYNSRRNAITRAIAVASPAVVGINVTEIKTVNVPTRRFNNAFFDRFFKRHRRYKKKSYEVKGGGSGFIISKDGYILTNHHVAGNAAEIIVTLTNGKDYQAEIIGSDIVSDVALLKIDAQNLPYMKLDKSNEVIIGEWAIAMGNPFGLFDKNAKPTVTVGVVSNTGVSFVHNENNDRRVYKNMIQSDAAISSGNSGGPLLNSNGEVIGMNTMIFSTSHDKNGSGSIGIGFSIPIRRVMDIVEKLKSGYKIERNFYTGIEPIQITERIANYFKLEEGFEGLIINRITKNSPADMANFEPGDIILEINGNEIKDIEDYSINIFDSETGDRLKFLILHDNKMVEKNLLLIPRPRRFR